MDDDTGLIRASVAYPLAGDGSRSRLLLGAGLHFLGAVGVAVAAALLLTELVDPVLWVAVGFVVVLLGYLPLLGYTAATVRSLLEDEAEPPEVGDWSAMLRDGRRVAGVVALYALPAVLVATASIALGGVGAEATTASLATAGLAAVLALAALYVLPAAAVAVVERGGTAAAWDTRTLREAVVDRRYLGPWVVGATAAGVGGAVAAPLSVVLVGFPLVFAAGQAATHAATRGVVESMEWTLEDPPAPPASGYIPDWDDGSRRKELTDGRLGGSLLPTTPDEEDESTGDAAETPPTPGSLATTDDGASAGGVDATAGSPDDGGAAATGSDITPFVEGDGDTDLERADEEN